MVDLRTSIDFEDIVYVLRNRDLLVTEILEADSAIQSYLSASFRELLSLDMSDEAIASVLDYGEPIGTQSRIRSILQQISQI